MATMMKYQTAARSAWDYKREDAPNYGADLPQDKDPCTAPKKKSKTPKKKRGEKSSKAKK